MTPKKSDIILGEEGVKNRRKSSDVIYVRSLTKIYFKEGWRVKEERSELKSWQLS